MTGKRWTSLRSLKTLLILNSILYDLPPKILGLDWHHQGWFRIMIENVTKEIKSGKCIVGWNYLWRSNPCICDTGGSECLYPFPDTNGAERMRRERLNSKMGVCRFVWVWSKGHTQMVSVGTHPCRWAMQSENQNLSGGVNRCGQVMFWPEVFAAVSPFFASWFNFLCWWHPLFRRGV